MGARRIGDEHDREARGPRGGKRLARMGKGFDTVMKDAPDVAEHHVVLRGDVAEGLDALSHQGFPCRDRARLTLQSEAKKTSLFPQFCAARRKTAENSRHCLDGL